MLRFFHFYEKAAFIAAFSVFTALPNSSLANMANVQKGHGTNLKKEELRLADGKKKITSLLLLKQRSQALDVIHSLQSSLTSIESKKQLSLLKQATVTAFLNPEAQDFFELAAGQYLLEPKIATKNIQKCLALEPDQFHCLWAEIKIIAQNKDSGKYQNIAERLKLLGANAIDLEPLILSLNKNSVDFTNMKFESNHKSDLYDAPLLNHILNFDRSFIVKNFSLARDILALVESQAPDYADIVIMRAKLEKQNHLDEVPDSVYKAAKIYQKKCESITANTARKYFYDVDFCKRTLE